MMWPQVLCMVQHYTDIAGYAETGERDPGWSPSISFLAATLAFCSFLKFLIAIGYCSFIKCNVEAFQSHFRTACRACKPDFSLNLHQCSQLISDTYAQFRKIARNKEHACFTFCKPTWIPCFVSGSEQALWHGLDHLGHIRILLYLQIASNNPDITHLLCDELSNRIHTLQA